MQDTCCQKHHWIIGLLLLVALLLAGCGENAPSSPTSSPSPDASTTPASSTQQEASFPQFDDVRIRVLTLDDPDMLERLKRRTIAFESMTNVHITLADITPAEQRQMVLPNPAAATSPTTETTTTSTTSTVSISEKLDYDVLILPPHLMQPVVQAGQVEDLTRRVQQDIGIQWDDIAPFIRNYNATYNQYIFSIPIDGSLLMVYYRRDLLNQADIPPPQTWEDYIAIARYFHGRDLNGDSVDDYGSCISLHDNIHDILWAVASSMLQSQGTQQGTFFDAETMRPLFANDGFVLALDTLRTIATYGPPATAELDYPTIRNLFATGRCVLTIDRSNTPLLAHNSTARSFMENVGVVMLPGSPSVLDRTSGNMTMTACTPTTCPYAIDGINHAPYAASGSWSGAINAAASPAVRDASYAFLSYLSQPVRHDTEGSPVSLVSFSPYRTAQFTDTATLVNMGVSESFARGYLQAVEQSMTSENVALDLRIPQSRRYEEVILDKSLTEFLGGIISRDQAIERMETGWERITDEAGRDEQQRAYRASLGGG